MLLSWAAPASGAQNKINKIQATSTPDDSMIKQRHKQTDQIAQNLRKNDDFFPFKILSRMQKNLCFGSHEMLYIYTG